MNYPELYEAKEGIDRQKEKVVAMPKSDPTYCRELEKYLEMAITIYGHAWCMNVASERWKMSKIVAAAVVDLK